MKIQHLIVLLVILINDLNPAKSEELLELSCLSQMECTQFEHTGIKADCVYEHCHCTTTNGEAVKCKPKERKLSNIIGGPCPCQQPNAECDKEQDTCYCATDFMPSSDKRRCIKKSAVLEEKCELDLQCQKGDYNAICHRDFKQCMCMELFVNDAGKCVSIVGPKFVCHNDTQCIKQFHDNSRCFNNTQHCVCSDDYISSFDNSHCQEVSAYLDNCTENMQCIATMGLGGKCKDNHCQCDDKYFVEARKLSEGVWTSICSPVIVRGQYCRYSEDCYQRQLNESEQSMDCIYGECNCKFGYNVFNDGDCFYGGAEIKSVIGGGFLVLLVALVNIYG